MLATAQARAGQIFLSLLVGLAALVLLATPAHAAAGNDVQTSWRLLDYIAVDYPGAVKSGRVINDAEYAEMAEFSRSVTQRIAGLPSNPAKQSLTAASARLEKAIAEKSPPPEVARLARGLGDELLRIYPVPLAPAKSPDLRRGATLYAENCASCHGAKGEGPQGAFAQLDPAPIAFTDRDRARERSLFGLYQVISQGLEGTAMQSWSSLPDEDRWALAFHVGGIAFDDVKRGRQIWRDDASIRKLIPDTTALTAITPADLAAKIGPDKAMAVTAFLRAEPGALSEDRPQTLQLSRERLQQSLTAYGKGDARLAKELALSAYLDGFEPVEAVLATRDSALLAKIERAMGEVRSTIGRGEPVATLGQRVGETQLLLDEAEKALAPEAATDISTFLGAFTILLREGLEALLVVIAMIAFLRKAEREEALPYVHGGWVGALVAGAGTWAVATYVIGISGASRELTEGFGSLLAAVILLSVGVWMHGKSQAAEWRRYIQEKMQGALSKGSAWFLFGLSFIVVYREVFETILFYAALWTPDNGATILAGALSAVALLAIVAWVMLRYSRTLPIGQFFRYSAILIAILAVVLAGKGIAALQEAGMIPVTPLASVPRITILGLFPTAQAIAAQLLALGAVLIGFRLAARPAAASLPAE